MHVSCDPTWLTKSLLEQQSHVCCDAKRNLTTWDDKHRQASQAGSLSLLTQQRIAR